MRGVFGGLMLTLLGWYGHAGEIRAPGNEQARGGTGALRLRIVERTVAPVAARVHLADENGNWSFANRQVRPNWATT